MSNWLTKNWSLKKYFARTNSGSSPFSGWAEKESRKTIDPLEDLAKTRSVPYITLRTYDTKSKHIDRQKHIWYVKISLRSRSKGSGMKQTVRWLRWMMLRIGAVRQESGGRGGIRIGLMKRSVSSL